VPELPEVETVARTLRPHVSGATILGVQTSRHALRRPIPEDVLHRACVGARFETVERVGKYLLIAISSGSTLLVHLGMSGRLLMIDSSAIRAPHTHLVFTLAGGRDLRYVDPRRFGVIACYSTDTVDAAPELAPLGPDPFTSGFTVEYLARALAGSRRDLKSFLLDQRQIAGLGNIYVCEALFRAGLSPRRSTSRMGDDRSSRLHEAILHVLSEGIRNRGTSFSDYLDVNGEMGQNQAVLWAYGREGEQCRKCGGVIRRLVQGGRSTFYCPVCQK
jgi:formamidopyrimidine-DNA glycosylase